MQTAHLSNDKLEKISLRIRESIVTMLAHAGSGHSAGALGMADIFTALYFGILKHDPQIPDWDERDYLLVSNGHTCPVWYAALAEAGYFNPSELQTLRQMNSRLQGHPHLGSLPGIENTSGPLAQGLSQSVGLALSLRMDNKSNRVYCMMSDGEQQEGQNWEAYLFAGARQLDNLTVLIDRNYIQIDGYTQDVLPLDPLAQKLEAFHWNVLTIDGHDFDAIINAAQTAKAIAGRPTAIICNTIPGRGVDFMTNDYTWHGKPPSYPELQQALSELKSQTVKDKQADNE